MLEPVKVPLDKLSHGRFITVDPQRNFPPQLLCPHRPAFLDNLPGNPASGPVEHGKTLRQLLPC